MSELVFHAAVDGISVACALKVTREGEARGLRVLPEQKAPMSRAVRLATEVAKLLDPLIGKLPWEFLVDLSRCAKGSDVSAALIEAAEMRRLQLVASVRSFAPALGDEEC